MKVEIMEVSGIKEALYGLGLSYDKTKAISWEDLKMANDGLNCTDLAYYILEDMVNRANKSAPLGKGHNKFLESIQVWLNIEAPRFWWSEMDTYRLATKQSDSTMHSLLGLHPHEISQNLIDSIEKEILDFEQPDLLEKIKVCFEKYTELIEYIYNNNIPKNISLQAAKSCLPEAWQQQRIVNCSYKTLKNIYEQRKNHRLSQWQYFCKQLKELPYSEWITGETNDKV